MNPYSFPGDPSSGPVRRRSKALTVLLSMVFPGTGHLYLGQLPRGVTFMLLFVADIMLLTFINISDLPFQLLFAMFFGLMIPVIYLVSLFDGVHHADAINAWAQQQERPSQQQNVYPYPPVRKMM